MDPRPRALGWLRLCLFCAGGGEVLARARVSPSAWALSLSRWLLRVLAISCCRAKEKREERLLDAPDGRPLAGKSLEDNSCQEVWMGCVMNEDAEDGQSMCKRCDVRSSGGYTYTRERPWVGWVRGLTSRIRKAAHCQRKGSGLLLEARPLRDKQGKGEARGHAARRTAQPLHTGRGQEAPSGPHAWVLPVGMCA